MIIHYPYNDKAYKRDKPLKIPKNTLKKTKATSVQPTIINQATKQHTSKQHLILKAADIKTEYIQSIKRDRITNKLLNYFDKNQNTPDYKAVESMTKTGKL